MDSGHFIPWDVLVPSTQSLIEKGAVITLGETLGLASDGQKQSSGQSGDLVSTIDTVRYAFLTSLLLLNKNPVLLTGRCMWIFDDEKFTKDHMSGLWCKVTYQCWRQILFKNIFEFYVIS